MTAVRRRGLQIDDPLGPGRSTQPTPPDDEPTAAEGSSSMRNGRAAGEPTDRAASTGAAQKRPRRGRSVAATRPVVDGAREPAAGGEVAARAGGVVWREWSGLTGVGSFRLPHELLAELSDSARELGLPIGLIVAAAVTQLLDESPEEIAALVDKADDARIHGRRTARRRLTERASR